jgi:hypothetical protein
VKTIGVYAFEGNGLTSLSIPDSVTSIGVVAFGTNTELTTLKLSNSLTHLPYGVFYYAPLTSVTIPASVRTIDPYVFVASVLTDVYFLGDAPSATNAGTGNSSFIGSSSLKLHYNSSAGGWSSPWRGYTTLGDLVGNLPDRDDDGLPDSWEINGVNGLNLPEMGADPDRPDIFLEIDWMEKQTCFAFCWVVDSWRPHRDGLQRMVDAFAAEGVTLHVDAGGSSPGELKSGGNAIPWKVNFGTSVGSDYSWSQFDSVKQANFSSARQDVFHYAVMVEKMSTENPTGMSRDIPGRDFIVADGFLSKYGGHTSKTESGTIMHELGHNLGLRHGGPDDTRFAKNPIYKSVMNYAYQLGAGWESGALYPSDPSRIDYSDVSPYSDWRHLRMANSAGQYTYGGQFGTSGPPTALTFIDELTEQEALDNDAVASPGDGSANVLGPYVYAAGTAQQVVHVRISNPSSSSTSYRLSAAINGTAAPEIVEVVPGYSHIDVRVVFDATGLPVGDVTLKLGLWSATVQAAVDNEEVGLVGLDMRDPAVAAAVAADIALAAELPDAPPSSVLQTAAELTKTVTLKGFYQPVDAGTLNLVKSGATVPLKFEIFAGDTELIDVTVVDTFKVRAVNCTTLAGVPTDDIEQYASGATILRYDTTGGHFIQNWQTPKGKAGSCYQVNLTTDDGSTLMANFKLK